MKPQQFCEPTRNVVCERRYGRLMSTVSSDVAYDFQHTDGTPVPFDHAKYAWAQSMYGALIDIARTRDALVTYQDIADIIQSATGITTARPATQWIDVPLTLVAEMCVRNSEPQLTALVVTADTNEVDDSFSVTYSIAGQPVPRNLQRAADAARRACHDHFSRREAVGWDRSKLTGRTGPPRTRTPLPTADPKPRTERRQVTVCPQCHLELLPSMRCAYCE